MNSVGTFVLGPDDVATLELLNVVSVVLNRVFCRVAQATAFPTLGAPGIENVLWQSTGPGLCGPVNGAVLEVNVTSLAIRGSLLTGRRVAKPGVRATKLGVAGTDPPKEHVRTGLRGPVGATAAEVLGLAALDVVFVVHAGTEGVGLGYLGDSALGGAVGTTVRLSKLEGVCNVGPCLSHLELPVRPVVHARRTEYGRHINVGLLRAIHKGLRGHAGQDF